MTDPHPPLAVIGLGNMGRALVEGGLAAGVLDPAHLALADTSPAACVPWRGRGIAAFETARDAAAWVAERETSPGAGTVFLAVKPQHLAGVAAELRPFFDGPRRGLISILAGTPTAAIRAALPSAVVVRAMPNLAVRLRQGCVAWCRGEGAAAGDEALAVRLFQAVAPVVIETREDLLDAFTAVAGSGPAYLFHLAEAMEKAAAEVGFAPDEARRIVRQTLVGAAGLLGESSGSPGELRAAVTSKGGTTAAASGVLEARGVAEAVVAAIVAARDRGREISRGAST